jgi:two-component system, OmpR family, response regulator CpxR
LGLALRAAPQPLLHVFQPALLHLVEFGPLFGSEQVVDLRLQFLPGHNQVGQGLALLVGDGPHLGRIELALLGHTEHLRPLRGHLLHQPLQSGTLPLHQRFHLLLLGVGQIQRPRQVRDTPVQEITPMPMSAVGGQILAQSSRSNHHQERGQADYNALAIHLETSIKGVTNQVNTGAEAEGVKSRSKRVNFCKERLTLLYIGRAHLGVEQGKEAMDRVLVVDDDVELCDLVKEFLEPEGLQVEAVHNGNRGLDRALSGEHALVVLDVMLPGMNGLDVLRKLRASSTVPVLLLTARGQDVDRIVGLELGADDYLPKPFNPRELVARIRAILRRTRGEAGERQAPQTSVRVGDVELNPATRTVLRGGEAVDLTAVEFNLLDVLLREAGRVVTRDELAKIALGRMFSPYDRSIDMHISKLRKKLGEDGKGGERIKTVRGVGYIYAAPGGD